MRWTVGSGDHGCWLGRYEQHKQVLVREIVRPGSVVYDLGAHVGFFTLLFSRLAGPGGRVVAFEPAPRNLRYLRDHLRQNRIGNVTVVEAAVSNSAGEIHFDPEPANPKGFQGHVAEEGALTVRSVRLDDLVRQGTIPPPDYIKIDVEGAEAEVLRGAAELLRESRPTLFLATHGREVQAECLDLLRGHGYRVEHVADDPNELLATPGARRPPGPPPRMAPAAILPR
jgi:FkbM family methyltransferase